MYWKPSVEYCRRGLLSVTRCGKKQSGEDSNCCRRSRGDGDDERGDDDDAISILDHIKYMLLICAVVKSWWLY